MKSNWWFDVVSALTVTGIVSLIGMTYNTSKSIDKVSGEVKYLSVVYSSLDLRLTNIEKDVLTRKDAKQLELWTQLKLSEIKLDVEKNKNKLEELSK